LVKEGQLSAGRSRQGKTFGRSTKKGCMSSNSVSSLGCRNKQGNSSSISLTTGNWWLVQGSLKKQGRSTRVLQQSGKPVLSIPEGMEVLILGRAGLNQLLGKINVNALLKHVEDRRHVTTFSQCFFTTPLLPAGALGDEIEIVGGLTVNNKDAGGHERGDCKDCGEACGGYVNPGDGGDCKLCGCKPARHNLEKGKGKK